jgi:hypothetical protein
VSFKCLTSVMYECSNVSKCSRVFSRAVRSIIIVEEEKEKEKQIKPLNSHLFILITPPVDDVILLVLERMARRHQLPDMTADPAH